MGRGVVSGFFWGALTTLFGLWLVSQLSGMLILLSTPPEDVLDRTPGETVLEGAPPGAEAPVVAPVPVPPETAPGSGAAAPGGAPATAPAPLPRPPESAGSPPAGADAPAAGMPAVPQLSARPDAPEEGAPRPSGAAQPPFPGPPPSRLGPPPGDAPPPAGQGPEAGRSQQGAPEAGPPPAPAPVAPRPPEASEAIGPIGQEETGARNDRGADGSQRDGTPAGPGQGGAAPPAAPAPPGLADRLAVVDFSEPKVVAPTIAPAPSAAGEGGGSASGAGPGPAAGDGAAGGDDGGDGPADAPRTAATGTPAPARPAPATLPVVRKAGAPVAPTQARNLPGRARVGLGRAADEGAGPGRAAADRPQEPGEGGAGDDAPAVPPAAVPALQRHAADFDIPAGRPLMAIILLPEEGETAAGGEGEPELPLVLSHAVDASRPDASERAAALRRAGREVVMLAPLPAGAGPRDVEVAFQAYLAAVPEAVAVLDGRAARFQSSRQVAAQLVEILAETGHGMITYPRGFNSAPQLAERAGVPAALVFRVLDGEERDGTAIRRILDQAAFRAGQRGGVVLVAHDRPQTRRALLEWSLGNRARTVVLAPVSAVLEQAPGAEPLAER